MEDSNKKPNLWMNLLFTFLGTTLSILLTFGSGMLVVGLASVIIGQVFFGNRGVTLGIVSAAVDGVRTALKLMAAFRPDKQE